MRYVLENEILKIEIESLGAELKSVRSKVSDKEYMWYGDSKYWGRTSPVLFPFVGGLKNKEYHYEGNTYPMGQHGFARDMEFHMISQSESEIWFELTDTEETLKKYPFHFVLRIGYQLKDNEIKVLWQVENPSEKPMHFSIGAHPAFNCPVHGEEDKSGYRLYFAGLDEVHHYGNGNADGLAEHENLTLPLQNHRAVITKEFFDRCTYIIPDNQTKEVGLEDPDGKRIVTLYFDMPLFALWSPKKKNAPFLCIEPWFGRCDSIDFEGSLEEREYNNCLEGGGIFRTEYVMRFGE